MSQTVTIHRRIRFRRAGRRQTLCKQHARAEESPGRIPRVARLMACQARARKARGTWRAPSATPSFFTPRACAWVGQ